MSPEGGHDEMLRVSETVDRWRAHGFDVEMTDLRYPGDRHDVADYLPDRGWTTD
jgi:O-methyltransferase involved in polyketide biosynthesis